MAPTAQHGTTARERADYRPASPTSTGAGGRCLHRGATLPLGPSTAPGRSRSPFQRFGKGAPIVRHQRGAASQGNGGDHQVIGANRRALTGELSAEAAVFICHVVVERGGYHSLLATLISIPRAAKESHAAPAAMLTQPNAVPSLARTRSASTSCPPPPQVFWYTTRYSSASLL